MSAKPNKKIICNINIHASGIIKSLLERTCPQRGTKTENWRIKIQNWKTDMNFTHCKIASNAKDRTLLKYIWNYKCNIHYTSYKCNTNDSVMYSKLESFLREKYIKLASGSRRVNFSHFWDKYSTL